jgi:hypothetical protein
MRSKATRTAYWRRFQKIRKEYESRINEIMSLPPDAAAEILQRLLNENLTWHTKTFEGSSHMEDAMPSRVFRDSILQMEKRNMPAQVIIEKLLESYRGFKSQYDSITDEFIDKDIQNLPASKEYSEPDGTLKVSFGTIVDWPGVDWSHKFFRSSADAVGGNSGSASYNQSGEIIGLVSGPINPKEDNRMTYIDDNSKLMDIEVECGRFVRGVQPRGEVAAG